MEINCLSDIKHKTRDSVQYKSGTRYAVRGTRQEIDLYAFAPLCRYAVTFPACFLTQKNQNPS